MTTNKLSTIQKNMIIALLTILIISLISIYFHSSISYQINQDKDGDGQPDKVLNKRVLLVAPIR